MADSHDDLTPPQGTPLDQSLGCPGATGHADGGEGGAPRCRRCRTGTSDLDALLETPGFAGSVLPRAIDDVAADLPLLDQVVGVTVAGPTIMNDVGMHEAPVGMGGPIRCDASRITLRLNPSRLGSALVTDPAAHVPPTLRLFDAEGNTAHATYLTENSDRLAFEALSLARDRDTATTPLAADAGEHDTHDAGLAAIDQIALFDSILTDGGSARRAALSAHRGDGFTRVDARRVISALEHAALLGMPVTMCTAAPGCIQMRHDMLDGAREHRGSMVIASRAARVMINFNLVTECWITTAQGAWGRTGAIELYDRHGRASFIATQTGPVAPSAFEAWDHLMSDLADATA